MIHMKNRADYESEVKYSKLEKRIKRLERDFKKVKDILELSSPTDPMTWPELLQLDKKILNVLFDAEHKAMSTTEIAETLNMADPKGSGRTMVWNRLRRIKKISKSREAFSIVITESRKWKMNWDDFYFVSNKKDEATKSKPSS